MKSTCIMLFAEHFDSVTDKIITSRTTNLSKSYFLENGAPVILVKTSFHFIYLADFYLKLNSRYLMDHTFVKILHGVCNITLIHS